MKWAKTALACTWHKPRRHMKRNRKQHDKMIWIEPAKKNNKEKVGM
jgi:hypothetical protein